LVYDPVHCTICSKLFCKFCLDNWFKKNGNCPYCEETPNIRPLDKFKQARLDATVFGGCPFGTACQKIPKPLKYIELQLHFMTDCSQIPVDCPMSCGLSFPKSAWEAHYDMDCPKLKDGFPCHRCDLPIPKGETGILHDCFKALKEKVAKQKGLELTNKVLAEKVKQLI
jgi:hypothetical protein